MNKGLTKTEIEEVIEEIPVRRIGKPEDIANCAYMLMKNEYITGQVITVDGRLDNVSKKDAYLQASFFINRHYL